jgi:hypothetical protein
LAHKAVPTITCTSSNVVSTVLTAFAQVPGINVWYGPDTYMGRNLAQLFQSLAQLRWVMWDCPGWLAADGRRYQQPASCGCAFKRVHGQRYRQHRRRHSREGRVPRLPRVDTCCLSHHVA